MITRRHFITTGACASSALAVNAAESAALATDPPLFKKPVKIAIASYSYWHFRNERVPIETVMDKSAAIGVEAVDILHRQMDIEEKAPLDVAGRS